MNTPKSRHMDAVIAGIIVLGVGIVTGIPWQQGRCADVPVSNENPAKIARMATAFARERFVAYSPSEFNPLDKSAGPVSDESIRADLLLARTYFSCLVTYSCAPQHGLDRIVNVAHGLDMRVVVGIWDIRSVTEIETAVRLAKEFPETVISVLVGNETMLRGGAWEPLAAAIRLVKAALPETPVSTSEPIISYGNDDLCKITDFHCPNIHWLFNTNGDSRHDVDGAITWLLERSDALRDMEAAQKPVLVKEHGIPSGPEPFSEDIQAEYWEKLLKGAPNSESKALVFFEFIDLPFKKITQQSELSATEEHWGAYKKDRKTKPVLRVLPTSQRAAKP